MIDLSPVDNLYHNWISDHHNQEPQQKWLLLILFPNSIMMAAYPASVESDSFASGRAMRENCSQHTMNYALTDSH